MGGQTLAFGHLAGLSNPYTPPPTRHCLTHFSPAACYTTQLQAFDCALPSYLVPILLFRGHHPGFAWHFSLRTGLETYLKWFLHRTGRVGQSRDVPTRALRGRLLFAGISGVTAVALTRGRRDAVATGGLNVTTACLPPTLRFYTAHRTRTHHHAYKTPDTAAPSAGLWFPADYPPRAPVPPPRPTATTYHLPHSAAWACTANSFRRVSPVRTVRCHSTLTPIHVCTWCCARATRTAGVLALGITLTPPPHHTRTRLRRSLYVPRASRGLTFQRRAFPPPHTDKNRPVARQRTESLSAPASSDLHGTDSPFHHSPPRLVPQAPARAVAAWTCCEHSCAAGRSCLRSVYLPLPSLLAFCRAATPTCPTTTPPPRKTSAAVKGRLTAPPPGLTFPLTRPLAARYTCCLCTSRRHSSTADTPRCSRRLK